MFMNISLVSVLFENRPFVFVMMAEKYRFFAEKFHETLARQVVVGVFLPSSVRQVVAINPTLASCFPPSPVSFDPSCDPPFLRSGNGRGGEELEVCTSRKFPGFNQISFYEKRKK